MMPVFLFRCFIVLALVLISLSPQDGYADDQDRSSAQAGSTPTSNKASSGEKTPGQTGKLQSVTREFEFRYAGAITELEPQTEVSVWLPIAIDSTEQKILDRKILVPHAFTLRNDPTYGNQILHFHAKADDAGEIPFEITYRVQRNPVKKNQGPKYSQDASNKFLTGSKYVPINRNLSAEVLGETRVSKDSMIAAREIYDAINRRMKYDKPANQGWGRGDSVWACDSRYGNCTDFHSLFISLCREQNLPARFEIGFPISLEQTQGTVAGYHCWAKFAARQRWISVDISEANKEPALADYYFGNLPPDRITFSIGRDLQLSPAQSEGPVNFLIYPYAEVSGRTHTKFRKDFHFEHITPK